MKCFAWINTWIWDCLRVWKNIAKFIYLYLLQDECSFVSLRDVERAMLVFEYFYDKMDLFSPLMDSVKTEVW